MPDYDKVSKALEYRGWYRASHAQTTTDVERAIDDLKRADYYRWRAAHCQPEEAEGRNGNA